MTSTGFNLWLQEYDYLDDMQTTDGGDTSALRTLQVSSLDLQVTVEEEQSKDSETYHTTEDAGFIAIQAE